VELIVEKVSAIFILGLGFSYLLNPAWWAQYARLLIKQPQQIFGLLFVMLLFGSTLVVTHNIWVASPIVIVTILGWIMLFKGLSMMMFPKLLGFLNLSDKIILNIIFANGIVLTAAGGILFYILFFI